MLIPVFFGNFRLAYSLRYMYANAICMCAFGKPAYQYFQMDHVSGEVVKGKKEAELLCLFRIRLQKQGRMKETLYGTNLE